MAFVFHRRLALPLWAIVFFTVALTAPPPAMLFPMPPTTLFVIAAFGIAGIIIMMPGLVPWLRTSRSVVRVPPSRHQDQARAAVTMTAGTCVRTLDAPNRSERDDALDLVRMDDDGGWQMPRPPA
jgi:uncharacterized iron-regulated membrane protein